MKKVHVKVYFIIVWAFWTKLILIYNTFYERIWCSLRQTILRTQCYYNTFREITLQLSDWPSVSSLMHMDATKVHRMKKKHPFNWIENDCFFVKKVSKSCIFKCGKNKVTFNWPNEKS